MRSHSIRPEMWLFVWSFLLFHVSRVYSIYVKEDHMLDSWDCQTQIDVSAPCILWTFPNNRFQLRLSRYIPHIWTVIPDKDINVCRLCGCINSDIIRHSVAESRVIPLKEYFINLVFDENSIDLYNELNSCNVEQFLFKYAWSSQQYTKHIFLTNI